MRDTLRNDDAPDTAVLETAVLDATQPRAGLEDDLAKLFAVRKGKLSDCLDATGDHHSADVAFLEPVVADDF